MRIACLLAAAVFCLFTYWQLNDLEQYGTRLWYGWVLAYGAVAVISLVSAQRPLPAPGLLAGAGLALVASLIRATAIEWDAKIFYNESNPAGNETGGLMIVAIWLGFLCWKRKAPMPAEGLGEG